MGKNLQESDLGTVACMKSRFCAKSECFLRILYDCKTIARFGGFDLAAEWNVRSIEFAEENGSSESEVTEQWQELLFLSISSKTDLAVRRSPESVSFPDHSGSPQIAADFR